MDEENKTPGGGQEEETTENNSDKQEEGEKYRAKLNALNRFLKKEGYEFKEGKWVKEEKQEPQNTPQDKQQEKEDFDVKDYAFLYSKVHEDDVDEVVKAAKILGVSLREAVKDPMVESILKTRQANREAEEAQNTTTKGGKKKTPSPQELLKDLQQGKVPEPGTKEAEELFWAKRGGRPD